MRHWKSILTAVALLSAAPIASPAPAGEDGWVQLFNGKDLTGWEQRNGTAAYWVEDSAIVGRTSMGSPNSFLCTTEDYGDFELKFEVKVDDKLNSGVQIRSQANGRVRGPQVEIATDDMAGHFYGEALETGWLSVEKGKTPSLASLFKMASGTSTTSRRSVSAFKPGSTASRWPIILMIGVVWCQASSPCRSTASARTRDPTRCAGGRLCSRICQAIESSKWLAESPVADHGPRGG